LQGFSAPECTALCDPRTLSIQEACEIIRTRDKQKILLGSGIRDNRDYCRKILPQAEIWDSLWDRPGIIRLLNAAIKSQYSRKPIEPLYLRKSDAEENIGKIAAERGIDPEAATKLIQC